MEEGLLLAITEATDTFIVQINSKPAARGTSVTWSSPEAGVLITFPDPRPFTDAALEIPAGGSATRTVLLDATLGPYVYQIQLLDGPYEGDFVRGDDDNDPTILIE